MKCTGEKEGCRGCLKNNRECSYTYSQRSGPSLEQSPGAVMLPSPPATDRCSVPESMQHEEKEPPDMLSGGSVIGLPDESPTYHFSPGLGRDCDEDARYVNRIYSDINSSFPFHDVFFDHSLDTSSVAPTTTDASAVAVPTTTSDLTSPRARTDSSGGELPTNNNNNVAIRRDCSCLKRIMSTNEMVEICLVWAPRDETRTIPLGADEMLRYQKEALVNCESALRCGVCNLGSEQAMLVISICNKLLASIVDMRYTLPTTTAACEHEHEYQHQHQQQQPQQGRDRGFGGESSGAATLRQQHQQRWPPTISISTTNSVAVVPQHHHRHHSHHRHHDYILDGQEWSTASGSGGGGGGGGDGGDMGLDGTGNSQRRASVLGIDQWRIDDEDKLQILRSLSDDRARRLKHLVSMVGEVAVSNSWTAHRSMVRDLEERFAKEIPFID